MSFTAEVDRARTTGTVEDQTVDGEGRVKSMPTRDDGSDADLRTLYEQASDGGFSGTFSDFLEHLRTAKTVEDIETDGGAAKAKQVDENGDIITPNSGRLPSVLYDAQGNPVDVSSLVTQRWQASTDTASDLSGQGPATVQSEIMKLDYPNTPIVDAALYVEFEGSINNKSWVELNSKPTPPLGENAKGYDSGPMYTRKSRLDHSGRKLAWVPLPSLATERNINALRVRQHINFFKSDPFSATDITAYLFYRTYQP